MRRIAVINQKGGVGKTTITTNLGHALTLMGHRVTVIDLDPQGQLAASYGIFRAPSRGIDQVLMVGTDLRSVRLKVRDLLTLIPAGDKLGEVEELHEGGVKRVKLLREAMDGKLTDQDYILYDCPPSSGILVANAIFEADEALIPVGGDYLSLNGLAKMMITLRRFEPFLGKPLKQWIALSRFIPRRRLSKEVQTKLMRHFPGKVLATPIREAAVMAECPGAGRTIFEYRGSCRSAKEFTDLAHDLIERRMA
ncbi:MAG: ParA family protein [Pseudomonadota bacterium]